MAPATPSPFRQTLGLHRSQWLAPALSLAVAIGVLAPALGGGLFLLDWSIGSHGPIVTRGGYGLDGGFVAGLPLGALASTLARVVGSAASVLPYVVFFPLAAWGCSRLVGNRAVTQIASSLLFVVNPFVFDRLYAGQVGVLLGYAILPFALRAALNNLHETGIGRFAVAAWWALDAALSVHFLWITGIACLAVMVQQRCSWRAVGSLIISAVSVLVFSSYLFFAQLGQSQPVSVGATDLAAYHTQADPHVGLYLNVLGLYGFWRTGPQLAKSTVHAWPYLLGLILLLCAVGLTAAVRDTRRRQPAVVLCLAGTAGYFLALGTQGPTGSLFRFAYDHVHLFDVMREPQKFLALTALTEAACFGWGVQVVVDAVGRPPLKIVLALLLAVLPVDYCPTLFDGLNGQVVASTVPASYALANDTVGRGDGQVLALPWHEYLSFPWTGRVVVNPLPTLFDRPVISGDDVELPGTQSASNSTRSAFLEFLYANGAKTHHFGALVAGLGVSYVVLAKTVDWQGYAWLDQQADLTKILDTPDLEVYRNDEPVDQGHRVAGTVAVEDWGQVVALADHDDIARAAITVRRAGPGPVVLPPGPPPVIPVAGPAITPSSPVSARVPASTARYVTSAEPFARGWRLAGATPTMLANGSMVFRAPEGDTRVTFPHWRTTLVGYVVSMLAVVAFLSLGGTRRLNSRRHDPRVDERTNVDL